MAVAYRVIIWVFAVLHNSTSAISINEEQRTDPTRYLLKIGEWTPRDKGDALTIWIRLLYDLSEAGNSYSEGIEAMYFFTNIDSRTWDIATRVIKQYLKQVDMHCLDNL
jgi:hypothetical protein